MNTFSEYSDSATESVDKMHYEQQFVWQCCVVKCKNSKIDRLVARNVSLVIKVLDYKCFMVPKVFENYYRCLIHVQYY